MSSCSGSTSTSNTSRTSSASRSGGPTTPRNRRTGCATCCPFKVIRFANYMNTENEQIFWSELQCDEFIRDAALAAGTYRKQARGG